MAKNKNNQAIWNTRIKKKASSLFITFLTFLGHWEAIQASWSKRCVFRYQEPSFKARGIWRRSSVGGLRYERQCCPIAVFPMQLQIQHVVRWLEMITSSLCHRVQLQQIIHSSWATHVALSCWRSSSKYTRLVCIATRSRRLRFSHFRRNKQT